MSMHRWALWVNVWVIHTGVKIFIEYHNIIVPRDMLRTNPCDTTSFVMSGLCMSAAGRFCFGSRWDVFAEKQYSEGFWAQQNHFVHVCYNNDHSRCHTCRWLLDVHYTFLPSMSGIHPYGGARPISTPHFHQTKKYCQFWWKKSTNWLFVMFSL